jgi:hypothetical protein
MAITKMKTISFNSINRLSNISKEKNRIKLALDSITPIRVWLKGEAFLGLSQNPRKSTN